MSATVEEDPGDPGEVARLGPWTEGPSREHHWAPREGGARGEVARLGPAAAGPSREHPLGRAMKPDDCADANDEAHEDASHAIDPNTKVTDPDTKVMDTDTKVMDQDKKAKEEEMREVTAMEEGPEGGAPALGHR